MIPFIELAYESGIEDLNAPQPGCIRGYKTHAPRAFSAQVDGTKCIYVARNPLDVRSAAVYLLDFQACYGGFQVLVRAATASSPVAENVIRGELMLCGYALVRARVAPKLPRDVGSVW